VPGRSGRAAQERRDDFSPWIIEVTDPATNAGATERIVFRCECGEPECRETVTLTADAYLILHSGGQPVLAAGHMPSVVAPLPAELLDDGHLAESAD
jgi:hypothetical protein